ncbi:MAG: methyltransferase [Chloroflexaceae bacterium]|nr:methyltransferase [Chloroflexaceae bacterium]
MPEAEIRTWLHDTLVPVQAQQPRRVYEIGCGTGMLLFALAGGCSEYWASDPAGGAIAYVRQHLAQAQLAPEQVRLLVRPADDFSDIPQGYFDTLIINSVVHYFPTADYLLHVLRQAFKALAPGGMVLVGDVRNMHLLRAFHTSVQLFQAAPDLPIHQLRHRVQTQLLNEEQLTIDPAFFAALHHTDPQIARVEIRLKRSPYPTEHTRFRYNALLYKAADPATGPAVDTGVHWRHWQEDELTIDGLRAWLTQEQPRAAGVTDIFNARVLTDAIAVNLLLRPPHTPTTTAELRRQISGTNQRGIDPDRLRDMGESLGYTVQVGWSPNDAACFDVLFTRPDSTPPPLPIADPQRANRSGSGRAMPTIRSNRY